MRLSLPNAPKNPWGGWTSALSALMHARESASRQKSTWGHSSTMSPARFSFSHSDTANPPWPSKTLKMA